MSKKINELNEQIQQKNNEINGLKDEIIHLQNSFEKEVKRNRVSIEELYRKMAQMKRKKIDNGMNLFETYKTIRQNDLMETAISIFEYENLPKEVSKTLSSKRINLQKAKYGSVVLFQKNGIFFCLPFTGVSPIDCYMEFVKVKPYAPSPIVNTGNIEQLDYEDFNELTVGVDCVILSDYFSCGKTNNNKSLTIEKAIELYSWLLADIEASKKINRNWINFPLTFSYEGDKTENIKYQKFIDEVKDIIEGVENHSNAIASEIVKNLKVLQTGSMYYGEELEQAKKDYENELFNFLGIGVIRNETRERKITAEFEKTKDQYNINITKRLMTMNEELEMCKKIFPNVDFSKTSIKVNLNEFSSGEEEDNDSNVQKTDNNRS